MAEAEVVRLRGDARLRPFSVVVFPGGNVVCLAAARFLPPEEKVVKCQDGLASQVA